MTKARYTAEELATTLKARLVGDPQRSVKGIATLGRAGASDLTFLANSRYKNQAAATKAGLILVSDADAGACQADKLIVDDPYLAYARVSHFFDHAPAFPVGIHPSAVIDPTVVLGDEVAIGANVVVDAHAQIGSRVSIGPNTTIGAHCILGDDVILQANVTLYHHVSLGSRVSIHSGTVIGADGFGYAKSGDDWIKIAQIGGVEIGDDVEIGACTSIDRGALSATRIGHGVIIDNQVQIAHNVEIGAHTAIAGCVGIAGSTRIGAHCTIAGAAGLAGHLEIVDGVHIAMQAQVTHSLLKPGSYSSGTGILPTRQWRRLVGRWRQLDRWASTIKAVQRQFK